MSRRYDDAASAVAAPVATELDVAATNWRMSTRQLF
jgi:hypothetical protein